VAPLQTAAKNAPKSDPKTIEDSDCRAAVANWTNTNISLLLGPRRRGRALRSASVRPTDDRHTGDDHAARNPAETKSGRNAEIVYGLKSTA
jgi:hypothetical protein